MRVSPLALAIFLVGFGVAPAFLATVPEADAAPRAKAKCRVRQNPARVQIAVDADGLAAGTAQFQVTSGANTSSVLSNTVDAEGDAAAEWDSAANAAGVVAGDPAEGTRGTISATFVGVGGTVNATVKQGGAQVATTSATCVAK